MRLINVLIVDDSEDDRYIARRQLIKEPRLGEVAEVVDGAEALKLFESGEFGARLGPHPPRTLVLLDINMPRMNGFELLDRLEASQVISAREISVVTMLTSSSYFGDRDRAAAYSLVEGYIEKPLTSDKITTLLDRHWPEMATDLTS